MAQLLSTKTLKIEKERLFLLHKMPVLCRFVYKEYNHRNVTWHDAADYQPPQARISNCKADSYSRVTKITEHITQLPKLCFSHAIYALQPCCLRSSAALSTLLRHAIYALPRCYLRFSATLSMLFSTLRVMLQQIGRIAESIK
jgi:hypothetical protein